MLINAATTPLQVANLALALIGERPVVNFSEETPAAVVLNLTYEVRARAALSFKRWRFCMVKDALVRLAPAPVEGFSAAYQTPATALVVHSVSVGGIEIAFDRFGDTVHCNAEPADVVVADFAYRAPETLWTPHFTEFFMERLAGDLAISVQENDQKGAYWHRKAEGSLGYAASTEAQNRTPSRLDAGAFIRTRRR